MQLNHYDGQTLIRNSQDNGQLPIASSSSSSTTEDIEYYSCDPSYLSGSKSAATSSLTPSQAITCNVGSTSEVCTLSGATVLFDDSSVSSATCGGDTWTYDDQSVTTNNIQSRIYNDYFDMPDPAYCTKLPTRPNETTWLASTSTCSNAVLGVRHIAMWSGANITRILTRVLVADLTFGQSTSAISQLTQMFQLKWVHEQQQQTQQPSAATTTTTTTTTTSTPTTTTTTTTALISSHYFNSVDDYVTYTSGLNGSSAYTVNLKSGTLGYSIGKPLITGYLTQSTTTSTQKTTTTTTESSATIDLSISHSLSALRVLDGKLCGVGKDRRLERDPVRFGYNTSASCVVRVAGADMSSVSSCRCLKRIIFSKLNSYYAPANYVSRNGNPNMALGANVVAQMSDWLSIYPTQRSFDSNFANNADPTTRYNNALYGKCEGVPSKLNVWFVYKYVGTVGNGEPVYAITGSYLK